MGCAGKLGHTRLTTCNSFLSYIQFLFIKNTSHYFRKEKDNEDLFFFSLNIAFVYFFPTRCNFFFSFFIIYFITGLRTPKTQKRWWYCIIEDETSNIIEAYSNKISIKKLRVSCIINASSTSTTITITLHTHTCKSRNPIFLYLWLSNLSERSNKTSHNKP